MDNVPRARTVAASQRNSWRLAFALPFLALALVPFASIEAGNCYTFCKKTMPGFTVDGRAVGGYTAVRGVTMRSCSPTALLCGTPVQADCDADETVANEEEARAYCALVTPEQDGGLPNAYHQFAPASATWCASLTSPDHAASDGLCLLTPREFTDRRTAPPAATTSTGTCAFQCAPMASPAQGLITPQIVVACNVDTDCNNPCNQRCPVPGNATTNGNGLDPASGTDLVCGAPAVNRPTCVPRQSASSTGTGGGPGQTANTAATLPNPVGTTDLVVLIGRVTKAIMGILGALALMWMVWGGVLWMTAEESKRTEDAKAIMKNAALGIVLLFFSYGLATAFLGIFQEAATSAGTRAPSATTSTRSS